MESERKLSLLEREYFHLQSVVESFDSKSLTIKAWSVTLGVSLAGSGAYTKNLVLLPFAAIAALLFWLIECHWKTFQYANYERISEIENFLSGKSPEIEAPQIAGSWRHSYRQGGKKRYFKILFWSHVFLPHGIMSLGFLAAYGVSYYLSRH